MNKISEIFNFDNIGGKIKGLVKWSCWITILLLWIATPILIIVAIVEGGDDAFVAVILFPIAAVIASFAIWVGSWAMYAFGELVDDNHNQTSKIDNIDKNIRIIVQPIIRETEKAVHDKAKNGNNRQPSSPLKPQKSADTAKVFPARSTDSSQKVHIEGEYVSGRTYYSGDEVIFEGKKYVCTAQNNTVWSPGVAPSQWQECSPSETEL